MNAKVLIENGQADSPADNEMLDVPSPHPDEKIYSMDEVDPRRYKQAIDQIHTRFIEQHTLGFRNAKTGKIYAPCSPEDAEKRWQQVLPRTQKTLLQQRYVYKLGLLKSGAKYDKPAYADRPGLDQEDIVRTELLNAGMDQQQAGTLAQRIVAKLLKQ